MSDRAKAVRSYLRKAVFLDKDGTLVTNVPYNVDPDKITLSPGALTGLTLLRDAGYVFVVVSNQQGIARGICTEDEVGGARDHLVGLLASKGIDILDFMYCPHDVSGSIERYRRACRCRKPLPGMIESALEHHKLSAESSWMVGDILDDVEAGNRAGLRTCLLEPGGETEWRAGPFRTPTIRAVTLHDTALHILGTTDSHSGNSAEQRSAAHGRGADA